MRALDNQILDNEKAYKLLKNRFSDKNFSEIILSKLKKDLVETGKILLTELYSIVSLSLPLEDINKDLVILIYISLQELRGLELPSATNYFSQSQISSAKMYNPKTYNQTYPIKFKLLDKLGENQYLITENIQEMNLLKKAGIIQWDKNIQRESITVRKGNDLVVNINYNDKRAREIGNAIVKNKYYSNCLRWHLIDNEYAQYEIKDNMLIIYSGVIAEIDGQHRDRGSEYALLSKPNIDLKFPILFTIGSIKMGKEIIVQEEKRQPFNKQFVKALENTIGNKIVGILKNSENLDELITFSQTTEQYKNGVGFMLEFAVADAIDNFYDRNELKTQRQLFKLSTWIIDFLNYIVELYSEDFILYKEKNIIKSWLTSCGAGYSLIYLSSIFYLNSNWEESLKKILTKISLSLELQKIVSTNKISDVIQKNIFNIIKRMVVNFNERG